MAYDFWLQRHSKRIPTDDKGAKEVIRISSSEIGDQPYMKAS